MHWVSPVCTPVYPVENALQLLILWHLLKTQAVDALPSINLMDPQFTYRRERQARRLPASVWQQVNSFARLLSLVNILIKYLTFIKY